MMADRLLPPILSYRDLRRRAGDFLRTYHPAGTIPVPIEEIVEFRYRMDIIPVPGLQDAFEVDGFISSDLKAITVDASMQKHRQGRYRFTLAHELAHAVLRGFSWRIGSDAWRTGNASSGTWTRRTAAGWSTRRTPSPD
jgi:hypothetical protein